MLIPLSELEKGTRSECANEYNDIVCVYAQTLNTYVIVYDDKKPLMCKRFTFLHEVGHIDLCDIG